MIDKSEGPPVGIFRMGSLGDTLVALPAIRAVRQHFPGRRIVYVTQAPASQSFLPARDILEGSGLCDSFLVYPAPSLSDVNGLFDALRKVRAEGIREIVYLTPARRKHQVARDWLFFFLAGARRFYGFRAAWNAEAYTVKSPDSPIRSEVDRILDDVAKDGISLQGDPTLGLELGLSNEEVGQGEAFLRARRRRDGQPVIAMGVGSKMPAKLWPAERYAQVVESLTKQYDPFFVFLGSQAEREVCDQVLASAGSGTNAAGDLSVRESCAVLRHCDLYVGNDTGTMHLAASEQVPCIALFTARTNPGRWYPYGKNHIVLRKTVPCAGCMLEVCDKDNLCLKLIETAEVTAAASAVLQGSCTNRA